MNHWMFRCKDVSKKVSHSMDIVLPLHHRLAVWMHLMMCRYCYRFRRQLFVLRKLSRNVDNDWPNMETKSNLSPEIKARMKKALRSHP